MFRLKELRTEKLQMSQQKLASLLGVSRSTIAMWETGASEPSNDMLIKLSAIFGVSTDYIIGNDSPAAETTNTAENNTVTLDEEAMEIMDFLRSRPEMKVLFSVSKNATSEDILTTVKILNALKKEK